MKSETCTSGYDVKVDEKGITGYDVKADEKGITRYDVKADEKGIKSVKPSMQFNFIKEKSYMNYQQNKIKSRKHTSCYLSISSHSIFVSDTTRIGYWVRKFLI